MSRADERGQASWRRSFEDHQAPQTQAVTISEGAGTFGDLLLPGSSGPGSQLYESKFEVQDHLFNDTR